MTEENGINFKYLIIIVADPVEMMRNTHKKYLLELGCSEENIILTGDGKQAFQHVQILLEEKKYPDLIISDWDMPNINGIEFLKLVKNNSVNANLKFLMVTGHEDKSDFNATNLKGLNGIILKPFKKSDYQNKIFEILGPKPFGSLE